MTDEHQALAEAIVTAKRRINALPVPLSKVLSMRRGVEWATHEICAALDRCSPAFDMMTFLKACEDDQ